MAYFREPGRSNWGFSGLFGGLRRSNLDILTYFGAFFIYFGLNLGIYGLFRGSFGANLVKLRFFGPIWGASQVYFGLYLGIFWGQFGANLGGFAGQN